MVVTISPSLSLYKIVVLPAASRPTIKIRISLLAKSLLKSFVNVSPISVFLLPHYGLLDALQQKKKKRKKHHQGVKKHPKPYT